MRWRVLRFLYHFSMKLSIICLLATALTAVGAPPIEELKGSLVIVGGGKLPDVVREKFVALAGKSNAKIVVIPTASASADKPEEAESYLKDWKKLNPASVVLLHTRDRKVADTDEFVKPITEATAVWFSGGDQARVTKAYLGTKTEKAFRDLLARGGTLGGTSAGAALMSDPMITGGTTTATSDTGFGFLPGFITDQHFLKRKRQGRLKGLLEKNPGLVGLGVDESTAVIVSGRTLEVLGDSTATVYLTPGAGQQWLEQSLKSKQKADLFQLRRAAANRAAKEPFPPVKPGKPVVERGALVIIGGGGTTSEIMNRFFALAGGKDALIVAVPTASETASAASEDRFLKQWGAKNVKVLHTRDRKTADDPEFSKVLLEAKGVWFGGGRQWRFIDAYENTLTAKRFREVLDRGGVIGGSSAGASIQSEYMPRGHPLGNLQIAAEGYEKGFGYLPGCAVDQHFFAKRRDRDMTGLMKRHPQFLGIGIDEATAIVVQGSTAEVLGHGVVAIYDAAAANQSPDYLSLKAGAKYDLATRKTIK